MLRYLALFALFVLGVVLTFMAGVYWCRWGDPSRVDGVMLKESMVILSPLPGKEDGSLPAGAVLYRVRDPLAKNVEIYRGYFDVIVSDSVGFSNLKRADISGRQALALRSLSWLEDRQD